MSAISVGWQKMFVNSMKRPLAYAGAFQLLYRVQVVDTTPKYSLEDKAFSDYLLSGNCERSNSYMRLSRLLIESQKLMQLPETLLWEDSKQKRL